MVIRSGTRTGSLAGALLATSLAAIAVSCGETTRPPSPARVLVESGDSQVGAAGQVLNHPLVVRVTGTSGQGVPGVAVTWTVSAGGGSLSGPTTSTDAAGLASVAWTLGVVAGLNRVTAVVAGLTPRLFVATSTAGPPARLAFSGQPGSVAAGTAISPAVHVAVEDAFGNLIPDATHGVTVALAGGSGTPGAALHGTTTVGAVGGVATFGDLLVEQAGTGYSLTATAAGLISAASTRFDVTAGPAAGLAFMGSPPDGTAGLVLNPAVRVRVEDIFGNAVAGATDTVTMAIVGGTGPPGAVLSGVLTVAAVSGRATFDSLTIDSVGIGYALTASARGLVSATSDVFRVYPYTAPFVTAGAEHSCGLEPGGVAYCWGQAASGRLGDGQQAVDRVVPVPVVGRVRFSALSAGGSHTCGLAVDSTAYCWGDDFDGQLGNDSAPAAAAPVLVSGGHRFVAISAGSWHTCAIASDAIAYCWGALAAGNAHVPTPVPGGLALRSVVAGGAFTCAVDSDRHGYCWGVNSDGELGIGDTSGVGRYTPTPVAGGLSLEMITADASHACGITTDGAAYCWGRNDGGQLGDGTRTRSFSPVPVQGGLTLATLTAGSGFTCGLTPGGAAFCWGWNNYGQLGDGTTVNRVIPTPVSGGLAFVTLDAGGSHVCGVTTGGSVYCWGANYQGQLGDGSGSDQSSPSHVFGFP
jgi:alpha-tubulin suppressor-like RCC1 family protein